MLEGKIDTKAGAALRREVVMIFCSDGVAARTADDELFDLP